MFRLTLLFLSLLTASAAAETGSFSKPPLVDLEFGVMCDVRPTDSIPAPGTVSGVLNLIDEDRQIDVVTQAVPAELGLSFGIRVRLAPEAERALLDVIVTHPPMGDKGQEVEAWVDNVAPGSLTLNLFSFEEPFELIEGPWLFQLRHEGDVVAEQSFLVTPKGTVPEVQQTCFGAMIMS